MIRKTVEGGLFRNHDGIVKKSAIMSPWERSIYLLSPILVLATIVSVLINPLEIYSIIGYTSVSYAAFVFFKYGSTYYLWKQTFDINCNMVPLYGLVQFEFNNIYYKAHVHPRTRKIQVNCYEDRLLHVAEVKCSSELFYVVDGQVRIHEDTLISSGAVMSYRGDRVRAYLEGKLVFIDQGGEVEYDMYHNLNKIEDSYIV